MMVLESSNSCTVLIEQKKTFRSRSWYIFASIISLLVLGALVTIGVVIGTLLWPHSRNGVDKLFEHLMASKNHVLNNSTIENFGHDFSSAYRDTFGDLDGVIHGLASNNKASDHEYVAITGTFTLPCNHTMTSTVYISMSKDGRVQIGLIANSTNIMLSCLKYEGFYSMNLTDVSLDISNFNGTVNGISFRIGSHFSSRTSNIPSPVLPIATMWREEMNDTLPPLKIEGWMYTKVIIRISPPIGLPIDHHVTIMNIAVELPRDRTASDMCTTSNFLVSLPGIEPFVVKTEGSISRGHGASKISLFGNFDTALIFKQLRIPSTLSRPVLFFSYDESYPQGRRSYVNMYICLKIIGEDMKLWTNISTISADNLSFALHPNASLVLLNESSLSPTLDNIELLKDKDGVSLYIGVLLALTIHGKRIKIPCTLNGTSTNFDLNVSENTSHPTAHFQVGNASLASSHFKGGINVKSSQNRAIVSGSLSAYSEGLPSDYGSTNTTNQTVKFTLTFSSEIKLVMELMKPISIGVLVDVITGENDSISKICPAFQTGNHEREWIDLIVLKHARAELSIIFDLFRPVGFNLTSELYLGKVGPFYSLFKLVYSLETFQWGYAFIFSSDKPISFETVSVEFGYLTEVLKRNPTSLTVGIASSPVHVNMLHSEESVLILPGFNMFGNISFFGPNAPKIFKDIRKYVPLKDFVFSVIALSFKELRFTMGVEGDFPVSSFDLTYGGIFILYERGTVTVGLEARCTVKLSDRPTDKLSFTGDLFLYDDSMGFTAKLSSPWIDPLGLTGVEVHSSEITLAVEVITFIPTLLRIEGGLIVDDTGGDVDVYLDFENMSNNVFVVYMRNVNLQKIFDGMLQNIGIKSPPHLLQVITDISFQELYVEFKPGDDYLILNDKVYYPGYHFSAKRMNLWEIIRGNCTIVFDDRAIIVDAYIEPINLMDGLITISGADSIKNPLVFYLYVDYTLMTESSAHVSGFVQLFEAKLRAKMFLAGGNFFLFIHAELFDNLLSFTLNCTGVSSSESGPADFSLFAQLDDHILDFIGKKLPDRLESDRNNTIADVEEVKRNISDSELKLATIENKITELKKEDKKYADEANKALLNAIAAIHRAKNKVDHLQKNIDDLKKNLRNLHWYDVFHEIGDSVAIAALEAAKLIADGVLSVAQDVLEGLSVGVEVLPSVDPRILALEAEYGIMHAVYDIAIAALTGVEKLDSVLFKMEEWILKAVSEVFNIEEIILSGSLKKLKTGDIIAISVKGLFFGKRIDFTLDASLQSFDFFNGAIWKGIVKSF